VVVLEALAAGFFIGAILGLVGAGGAILAVPAFVYLFGFSTLAATTASLAVVSVAAATGVIPRLRQHQVHVRQALIFWALGLLGTFAGSFTAPYIPDTVLLIGFSLLMIAAAVAMWRKATPNIEGNEHGTAVWLLILVALVIGFLTGLFGVGGGFLIVPALVLIFRFPFQVAAGTSLLVIMLNSLTALLFKAPVWTEVTWQIPLIMIAGAVIGSVTVAAVNVNISQRFMERAFAILLIVLALFMAIESLVL
jgi:uncharacterized protein